MEFYNVRDYLDETVKESNERSEIQTFYANKTVFITGASGFVGTLVLEKLLRTCKDLRKVYVLFRSSKKKSIQERLVDYFNDPVFYRMKTENPTYHTQVTIVRGDLSLDQLGLSAEDRQAIVDNTQIILHVAATVKFDEHLADAYNINVKGTKSLIQLAEQMRQLQSFVYVSTAYSNCDRKHIEEKFYDPVFSNEQTVTMLQHSERNEQAILLPHILDSKPNTYIFTKAVAEDLVRESSGHLPVVVVRPSVVMPTLTEPFPYYSNDKNSLLSLGAAMGVGLLRVVSSGKDNTLDMIPGDMTANCILAASWRKAVTSETPQVYNCVGFESPVLMRDFMRVNYYYSKNSKETMDKVMWIPHLILVENMYNLFFLYYFLHILPGMLFSLAERYLNRKPLIMKIYRKLFFLSNVVRYFVFNNWSFTNDNTKSLLFQLNTRDRELFDFNMASFDWNKYDSVLYRCIGVYFIKGLENKENLYPKEMYKRKKMPYIVQVDRVIRWSFRLGVVYLCYNIVRAVFFRLTLIC